MSGKSRRPNTWPNWMHEIGSDKTERGTQFESMSGTFQSGNTDEFRGHQAEFTGIGVNYDPREEGREGFGGGLRFFTGKANSYTTNNGQQGDIGFGANLVEGNLGYYQNNPNSRHDRSIEAGFSVGTPGGGAWWNKSDWDNDGHESTEVGIDLPTPVPGLGIHVGMSSESMEEDLKRFLYKGTGNKDPLTELFRLGQSEGGLAADGYMGRGLSNPFNPKQGKGLAAATRSTSGMKGGLADHLLKASQNKKGSKGD